jgi:hypothetical protein
MGILILTANRMTSLSRRDNTLVAAGSNLSRLGLSQKVSLILLKGQKKEEDRGPLLNARRYLAFA